ncbi:MAG: recombinase family protein [Chloroflexota bacterium]
MRVSDPKREASYSLETQEAACCAYATEHGYAVVKVFTDRHTGKQLFERPEIGRLREMVRAREVDVVIAYCVDRFTRNQAHMYILLDELDREGAALEFATEKFEDTAIGKFLLSAKTFAGELEWEKIRERTMRGIHARAKAGKLLPGSRVKYGYAWVDPEPGGKTSMRVSETDGPVVQRIFAQALAGVSIRTIANGLTVAGIPTPNGRSPLWRISTIHKILSDAAYTGHAVALRYQYGTNKASKGKSRPMGLRPEDEQIPLPAGTIPALVDGSTFAAVRERLALNKAQAARNNKHPEDSLLRAGYIRCGHCGYNMVVSRAAVRGSRYRCNRVQVKADRCQGQASIQVSEIDGAVWEHLRRILKTPSLIDAELQRTREQDPTEQDLGLIDQRLGRLERQRKNIAGNIALLDPDSAEALREQLVSLMGQYKALLEERRVVMARRQEWQTIHDRLQTLKDWCVIVGARVDTADYVLKRLAVQAFGIQVKVWRKSHEPRWEIRSNVDMDAIVSTSSGQCDDGSRPPT